MPPPARPDVHRRNADVFVEIPKFRAETALDKKIRRLWLRFLKEIDQGEFEPPPELMAYPPTREALDIAREAAFTEAELFAYQEFLDAIRVDVTLMAERTALALEEGLNRGMQKGLEKGMQKGLEEGLQKSIGEDMEKGALAEKQAIARNLLDVLDDATIAVKTGLSLEDVARLRIG